MNHSAPILYSFRRCPYAMRARLALYASGALVELREVVLRDKPAHMLEISPKGTVPVLLLQDGTVIDESFDIMIWALGRQDPDEWLGEDDTEGLIARNDGEFKHALDRYKYPDRYPDEDCSGEFDKALTVLEDLNTRIEKHGFLIADYPTLPDYAIFPFIRQFANTDRERFDALPLPALQKWLRDHLNSELFAAIMPKFDQWQDGDTPLMFGKNA